MTEGAPTTIPADNAAPVTATPDLVVMTDLNVSSAAPETRPTVNRHQIYAANGIPSIPIMPNSKVPGELRSGIWYPLRNWSAPATPEQLVQWDRSARQDPEAGSGIRCGTIVGVDVDVTDEVLADRIEKAVHQILGPTDLIRFGQFPKRLLVYRTNTPSKKITSAAYDYDGKKCQLEILGAGQQFVEHGVHPTTCRPYVWLRQKLLDTRLEDIPLVTEEKLRELIAAFDTIMEAAGAVQKGKGLAPAPMLSEPDRADLSTGADEVATTKDLVDRDGLVPDAMEYIENDLTYDAWIALGYALFNAMSRDPKKGKETFHSFSKKNWKYDFDRTEKAWNGFKSGDRDGARAGAGSIFYQAELAGWNRFGGERTKPEDDFAPVVAPRQATRRYQMFSDINPNLQQRDLIKGLLSICCTAAIVAPSGMGKSQLLVHLAVHIARGTPWCGRKTQMGAVICAVGEGAEGFRCRLIAIRNMDPSALTPIVMFDSVPDLQNPKSVSAFINDCNIAAEPTGEPIRAVFFDTLTTCTPGMDQNSTDGMSMVVSSLRRVANQLNCAAIVIHHTGKVESKGARGSSVLIGDLDTELRIESDGPGRFIVRQTKQRDYERGQPFRFVSRSVEIGKDADGDPVTAVYAENDRTLAADDFDAVDAVAAPLRPQQQCFVGVFDPAGAWRLKSELQTAFIEAWNVHHPDAGREGLKASFRNIAKFTLSRSIIVERGVGAATEFRLQGKT